MTAAPSSYNPDDFNEQSIAPDSANHWLIERIRSFGERPALMADQWSLSYADLANAINRAGSRLAQLKPAVTFVRDDFHPETIATLLAAVGTKHIVAPLTRLDSATLQDYAQVSSADCDAVLTTTPPRWTELPSASSRPPAVKQLLEEGRSGLILFSSGSSGKPKAMVHDLKTFLDQYRERKPRAWRVLTFLLWDHIGGLNTLLGGLAAGMTLVTPPSRDPGQVAETIQKHGVQLLPTTPTFLNLLLMGRLHETNNLHSLKVITYGAEAMPEALLQRIRKGLPRTKLIQTFGTSETGIARTRGGGKNTILHFEDPASYRIVEGELWLRSQFKTFGYLGTDGENERFTADGWFKTGDLVEETAPGSLRLLSRKSDQINVGGEKVYPAEVESVVLECPEVAAVKAYGTTNPITGQSVCVDIVPASDNLSSSQLRSIIRRHCASRMARFKTPTKLNVVQSLAISKRFKTSSHGPDVQHG